MLRKLRLKFICINMILVTVITSFCLMMIISSTRVNLRQQSIRTMETIAAESITLGQPYSMSKEVRLPYFVMQTDEDGSLSVAGGENFYELVDRNIVEDILKQAQEKASVEQCGVLPEYNLRYYHLNKGGAERYVFVDMSNERMTIAYLEKTCMHIGVSTFLIFLFLSIFLARWTVRPVEKAWQEQRQFVADASHELKTPLTVIMTNAEMLQSDQYDSLMKDRFSSSILTVSRQMRGLVENLLELARGDSGVILQPFEILNFSQIAENSILTFEALSFEKGLVLKESVAPEIYVRGTESQLQQVIDILLDNALKYSKPNGEILVTLEKQGKSRCLLSVTTPGEPLSKEECISIFRRFYRVDTSRSSHSYGLGLSIAQQYIQSHNGKIWAEGHKETMSNTFIIQLPTVNH